MSVNGNHTPNPGYKPGEHWNVCQRCGFDIYSSDTLEEWNGLKVCIDCWEPRHELDFVKGHPEDTNAKGLVTGDTTGSQGIITLQDNTSPTLVQGTDTNIHEWNTQLTATRTVTLSNTAAIGDNQFIIYKTAAGSALNINDASAALITSIPDTLNGKVVCRYNGIKWELVSKTIY